MRCEYCLGIGEVLIDGAGKIVTRLRDATMMIPCPQCGGSGLDHCCSGDILTETNADKEVCGGS